MRQHRVLVVSGFLLDMLGFVAFIAAAAGTAHPLVEGALAAISFALLLAGAALLLQAHRGRLEAQPARVRTTHRR